MSAMLLLFQISFEAVATGGLVLLVLFSIISRHSEAERQRQLERERNEAENKRLELELQIKEKELEKERLQTRRTQIKSIRLILSTFITVGVGALTDDWKIAVGVGLLLMGSGKG